MKTIFKTFAIIAIFMTFTSCATKMITKSPQEVKAMTTKQFEINKNLVFNSAISLLQSESYLVEDTFSYPVSFNGKTRYQLELPADMPSSEIEKAVLENELSLKWIEGKEVVKMIIVPKKIVNIVLK